MPAAVNPLRPVLRLRLPRRPLAAHTLAASVHTLRPTAPSTSTTTTTTATADAVAEWAAALAARKPLTDSDTVSASAQQLLRLSTHPLAMPPDPAASAASAASAARLVPLRANQSLDPDLHAELFVRPLAGSPIVPASHLTLFPPRVPEPLLAADGYDSDWSPPPPFVRRMWAGGVFEWDPANPLRVGQDVWQTTRLVSVDHKQRGLANGRTTGDAVFVTLDKDISNSDGFAMRETRSYVYLEAGPPAVRRLVKSPADPDFSTTVRPSMVTLFRYSALTFNSHLIHYDHTYAHGIEGYDSCLVHGPLTCTLLLNHFRLNAPDKTLTRFSYRAMSPVLVGRPLSLHGRWGKDALGKSYCELWASNDEGGLAMKGTAEYLD
ncbi:hypothetical protein BC831DRAFT_400467 [Entophlyctis helioformis]|nr:hypothetical protein BC831DRAFT_400467 [Entophlyctis helioformis]